jgi:RNA polymerase sigma factor (sigma-70 family)
MTDFSSLYKQYAPDVYRFAYYLSGDRGEAQDIASETFVRAFTSPEPIRTATVKGYLFTIARNLFLQGLRQRARQVTLDDNLHDHQPSPFRQAQMKEELNTVLNALQTLPEASRSALLMRAVDGLAYEEIALALGISLASVKVKIHRARLVLSGIREN